MIPRLILAALLAGLLAGLVMTAIQHLRLTPLIIAAEKYEAAEKPCVENMPGMKMCGEAFAPLAAEAINKTGLTSLIIGAGFALLLAAVSLLSGMPITPQNGLIWGLCGFIAVSLAPAAGQAPQLPGMSGADVTARQIWWACTVAATSISLWLIAARPFANAAVVAVLLIALPHLFGAPHIISQTETLPASLAATFVANSLAANAIMWALIGLFLGHAFSYVERKYS